MAAQVLIVKAADVELTANDGTQQVLIARVEEVEPGVAAPLLFLRLREFVEFVPPRAGIFDGLEELPVTPVGSLPQFAERRQTVDGFLHRGPFWFRVSRRGVLPPGSA